MNKKVSTRSTRTNSIIKNFITIIKKIRTQIRSDETGSAAKERYQQSKNEQEDLERKCDTAEFLLIDVDRLMKEILHDVSEKVVSDNDNIVTDE